jgi:hypothetical protein
VDLIGLEVLRLLEPDVHAGLPRVADILVDDRLTIGDREAQRQRDRDSISELLESAQEPKATRALLGQLFPRAQSALTDTRGLRDDAAERREKRVATPSVLRAYLHATLDDDALAASEVERLVRLFDDPNGLSDALDDLPSRFLDDALGRLMDYAPSFRPEQAVETAKILMRLERRLPEDRSPFKTGKAPVSWKLRWLVGRLLLSESDKAKRSVMATQLVEEASDLSGRLRYIEWFGTHPERENRDPDSEMIDEETTALLLENLRKRVADCDPADLASEHLLPSLLKRLLDPDPDAGRRVTRLMAANDELMLVLLSGHYGERLSHTLSEAAVRRIPFLAWRPLADLLGEDQLRRRIIELGDATDRGALDNDTRVALELGVQIARGEITPDPD